MALVENPIIAYFEGQLPMEEIGQIGLSSPDKGIRRKCELALYRYYFDTKCKRAKILGEEIRAHENLQSQETPVQTDSTPLNNTSSDGISKNNQPHLGNNKTLYIPEDFPDELKTEAAKKLWLIAYNKKWVDNNCMLNYTLQANNNRQYAPSLAHLALLAKRMGRLLGIKNYVKLFSKAWGISLKGLESACKRAEKELHVLAKAGKKDNPTKTFSKKLDVCMPLDHKQLHGYTY